MTPTTGSNEPNAATDEPPSRHAHFGEKQEGDGDNASSSSSDDEEDDEDVLAREMAFKRAATHRQNTPSSHHLIGATGVEMIQHVDKDGSIRNSLRRFDELGDFRTRSERTRSERRSSGRAVAATSLVVGELKKDEVEEKVSPGKKRRGSVQFHSNLERVLEIPELTEDDKCRCFMTGENWNSIDIDVELTRKRWENHMSGSIQFDRDNNCVRGLETYLMPDKDAAAREKVLVKHQYDVLSEQIDMQEEGKKWDDERLRKVSLQTSIDQMRLARGRAIFDTEECKRMWGVDLPKRCSCDANNNVVVDGDVEDDGDHVPYDLFFSTKDSNVVKGKKDKKKNENVLLKAFGKMLGGGGRGSSKKR